MDAVIVGASGSVSSAEAEEIPRNKEVLEGQTVSENSQDTESTVDEHNSKISEDVASVVPSKAVLCCRLAGIESDSWSPEACQYFKGKAFCLLLSSVSSVCFV